VKESIVEDYGVDVIGDVVFAPYYLADKVVYGKELSGYDQEDLATFSNTVRELLLGLKVPTPVVMNRFRSVLTGSSDSECKLRIESVSPADSGTSDADMAVVVRRGPDVRGGHTLYYNQNIAVVVCNLDTMRKLLTLSNHRTAVSIADELLDVLFECLGDDWVLGSQYLMTWWNVVSKYSRCD